MARDSDVARQSNLEVKYKKQEQLKDAFFGDFYVYSDGSSDSKIICIEKLISDKEALKREVEQIKKKILNKHDYILNLLDYSVEVQSNLCSTFYLLKTFYEYPNKSLKREINERKMQGGSTGNFKYTELTHLLYHQVIAHSYLQDNKITHGDISPSTIFLTNKGDYKVAFRLNTNATPEKFNLEKMMKNEPLYLSPTVYTALKRRNLSNIIHSALKSDVFSFGLCLLEAGLLRSVQSIYSKGDEIDQHMLNIYLDEFELKYTDNPLLFSSVRKMLEVDESERPTFTDLKLALPDYAEICDYFYKVEHGLINEEEEMWDENSPDPNNNFQYSEQELNQNNYQSNYGVETNMNSAVNKPQSQPYSQPGNFNAWGNNGYGAQPTNQTNPTPAYNEQPTQNYNNNNNGNYDSNVSNQNAFSYNQPNVNAMPNHAPNTGNPQIAPQQNNVYSANNQAPQNAKPQTNNNFFEKYSDFDFFSDAPVEPPKTYSQPQSTYNPLPQSTYNPAPQSNYNPAPQHTYGNQSNNLYGQPQKHFYGNPQTHAPQPTTIQPPADDFFDSYTAPQAKVSYTNQNNYAQPKYQHSYSSKRPESQQTYENTTAYTNDNNFAPAPQYGQPQNYYRGY